VVHFGEYLGNKVIRCPEDIPLPPSASNIPHLGNPRRRARRRLLRRELREENSRAAALKRARSERTRKHRRRYQAR
jgi:hypothetical protein